MSARWKTEPAEVLIGNTTLLCQRGEILFSIPTWAKRWGWSESKVKRFLHSLAANREKDGKRPRIELQNERKTTRIKVCNYEAYQTARTASEPPADGNRTASEPPAVTTEEENNSKNIIIEDEDARVAFGILKKETRLSSLSEEQFNAILAGLDPRPSDLPALARAVAREARMNGKEIQHPAVFIEARLPAVAEKMSEGENPKKNRAPALVLLRPAVAVDQRARLLEKAEKLMATEAVAR
jgi:hypothetical protein